MTSSAAMEAYAQRQESGMKSIANRESIPE
jgi:hypothetical protein